MKSLGGIRVKSAVVHAKGLEHDRRWMLIDEEGTFISQREQPILCRFQMQRENGQFLITYGDEHILLDPRQSPTGQEIRVRIWDDEVSAREVSVGHSQWFSKALQRNVKLVFFPEENSRPADPDYATPGAQVSLADGFPLLLIGTRSLDDLNSRLQQTVGMNRFRPNLVVEGIDPFEEDNWKEFTIGKNRFVAVKPCGRCIMTTINPETAQTGKEPLATLSRFRNKKGKVLFGQNIIPIDHHEIKEGDEIILH
ncbi:MAG: MOSC domain-containing protein [Bacteroidetes bacterium]|nr:MOSC domain-containing protein [Bacteroidota bacterium]